MNDGAGGQDEETTPKKSTLERLHLGFIAKLIGKGGAAIGGIGSGYATEGEESKRA